MYLELCRKCNATTAMDKAVVTCVLRIDKVYPKTALEYRVQYCVARGSPHEESVQLQMDLGWETRVGR